MVHNIDISKLNLEELDALISDAAALRAKLASDELGTLSARIEKLKAIVGLSKSTQGAVVHNVPQYQYWNKETGEGWTKRGPKPAWIKKLETESVDLSKYAVGPENQAPLRTK